MKKILKITVNKLVKYYFHVNMLAHIKKKKKLKKIPVQVLVVLQVQVQVQVQVQENHQIKD